jgi:hypothetical protein
MGTNAALDVAIALILMYLVLSLIVTVVNEAVATAVDLRALNLKGAIEDLIDDPVLKNSFYDHGLIAGINAATAGTATPFSRYIAYVYKWLTRADSISDFGHVSYLSGQTFALAVLGSVDTTKRLPTFDDIRNAVEQLPDTNIRDALLAQLLTANGDLQKLRDNVATWFDGAMDRVSGVYKRHLKQISFVMGLLLVFAANADTVKVAQSLWTDASLRAGMVQTASNLLANQKSPANASGSASASDLGGNLNDAIKNVRDAEERLRPLPLGWKLSPLPNDLGELVWILLGKVLGLVLTAIAISLGAPFWFDLLSMFMRVRGTGEKPKKTADK